MYTKQSAEQYLHIFRVACLRVALLKCMPENTALVDKGSIGRVQWAQYINTNLYITKLGHTVRWV